MKPIIPSNEVRVKPYSIKELCNMYGVCTKTFNNWLVPHKEEVGLKRGRYFTIKQIHLIFEKLGAPYLE